MYLVAHNVECCACIHNVHLHMQTRHIYDDIHSN